MKLALKIACLAIAGIAFIFLGIFGFAIWVFLPILPAAIIFLGALIALKREPGKKIEETEKSLRKAA